MSREHAEAIRVYCDDPRHARGKVAQMGYLEVIESPLRGLVWTHTPDRRAREKEARGNLPRGRWAEMSAERGSLGWVWACPLCPRRPAFTDEQLQTFADGWSREGYASVSLTVLDAHAASM